MTARKKPEPEDRTFTFESSVGDITLKTFDQVDRNYNVYEAIAANNHVKVRVLFIRQCADDDAQELLRQLPQEELAEFFDAWAESAGITEGE